MCEVSHNKKLTANEKGGLFWVRLIFGQKILPTSLLKMECENKKKNSSRLEGTEDDNSGSEKERFAVRAFPELGRFPRDSPSKPEHRVSIKNDLKAPQRPADL